jgi:hypothetical protein
MKLKTIILLAYFTGLAFSQTFIFQNEIGQFKQAAAFSINEAGIIYVTDANTNEIYKLDTLGKTLKYTGGFGWSTGEFDDPVNVFATPLNVYVCDKNNHRVERFDKDLNYVSQISTRNSDTSAEQFGYPLCAVTSSQGDLFILDSENKRIVKFDTFGNFISNFGGFDSGDYSLTNPLCFAISRQNNLYVIDDKKLIIFDQYGNGVAKFNTNVKFNKINILLGYLTINNENEIYYCNLANQFSLNKISLDENVKDTTIVSSIIFGQKLYVLTPEKILIYKKIND